MILWAVILIILKNSYERTVSTYPWVIFVRCQMDGSAWRTPYVKRMTHFISQMSRGQSRMELKALPPLTAMTREILLASLLSTSIMPWMRAVAVHQCDSGHCWAAVFGAKTRPVHAMAKRRYGVMRVALNIPFSTLERKLVDSWKSQKFRSISATSSSGGYSTPEKRSRGYEIF